MKYIASLDERRDATREQLHPFLIDTVQLEKGAGIADFTVYEYKNPTQEFLEYLSPKLGLGIFKTSYRIFAIEDFTLTPPYERYNFEFIVGGEYIDYKEYCDANNIDVVFADEQIYFITDKLFDTFPTHGLLLLNNNNELTFTHEAGKNTIKLSERLYIKSTIPFITVLDATHPLDVYSLHNGNLNNSNGTVSPADTINDKVTIVSVDNNHALSDLGLCIYVLNGENKHKLMEIQYAHWNKGRGVVDIKQMEHMLSTETNSSATITALYIFVDDLTNNSAEHRVRPDIIFKDYIEYARMNKFNLQHLVQNGNISVEPFYSSSPHLFIDYGNDEIYFNSLKSISRRLTRELVNAEYSATRYKVDTNLIRNGGIRSLKINNRFSQEISIFVNGRYLYKPYARKDTLGISEISIPEGSLNQYGQIKYMEVVVHAIGTKKVDLIKGGRLQYGDMAGEIAKDTHKNLIPVHSRFGIDSDIMLFINGNFVDDSYYHFKVMNGTGVIFIDKSYEYTQSNDLSDVTVILNQRRRYEKHYVDYGTLSNYYNLPEHSIAFFRGQLLPIGEHHDLYDAQSINIYMPVDGLSNKDRSVIFFSQINNPIWKQLLETANSSPLLKGFFKVDGKKIIFVDYHKITNLIKSKNNDNILVEDEYPKTNYLSEILQRTLFAYEYITIGKLIRTSSNEPLNTNGNIFEDVKREYPSVVKGNNIILDCNKTVIRQNTLNKIYEGYHLR